MNALDLRHSGERRPAGAAASRDAPTPPEPAAAAKGQPPKPGIFTGGDSSDAYANHKQLYLGFYHLAADEEIAFKAFITSFNQNFTSDWASEQVFGRNDPIMTFKNTIRKMNLSFEIPAASVAEAKGNLFKTNKLVQFMYPAYEKAGRANTIAKPPLMRLSFANLLKNPSRGESPKAKEAGLLVTVETLNITPSFGDDGFFDVGLAQVFPQLITIDIDCTVLHERNLGWDAVPADSQNKEALSEAFGFSNPDSKPFPFGMSPYVRPTPPPAAADPEAAAGESDELDGSTAATAEDEADAFNSLDLRNSSGAPRTTSPGRQERQTAQTLRRRERIFGSPEGYGAALGRYRRGQ